MATPFPAPINPADSPLRQFSTAIGNQEGFGASPGNLPTRMNNPGAMIYNGQPFAVPGDTVVGPDGIKRTFAKFDTVEHGYQAADRQLTVNANQGLTVRTSTYKWVTGSTNPSVPPTSYLNGITSQLHVSADSSLLSTINPVPGQTLRQPSPQSTPSVTNTIKSPVKEKDVEIIDPSLIRRNHDTDDNDQEWDKTFDIHEPYFASAEIKIGDVFLCPLAPIRAHTSVVSMNDDNVFGDQPIFVDVEVPGQDIRLEEFQFRSTTMGGGDIFTFRLFVKAWTDVIQMMELAAQKQTCSIRYGYVNPDIKGGLAGPYIARIVGITPSFLEVGYSVVIEAFRDLPIAKTAGWRAKSGRISDIVYHIAHDINKWDVCIEPTTVVDPHTVYQQQQQSDINFLMYKLAPIARCDVAREWIKTESGKGYSPYVVYLQNSIKSSGPPILHFHPRFSSLSSDSATPQRNYVWGGVQDASKRKIGTVVSFNPSFDNTAYLILGGASIRGTSVDLDSKILNVAKIEGTDITDRSIGGLKNRKPVEVNMSSPAPVRGLTLPYTDIEFLKSAVATRLFSFRDMAAQSSMTVLGDPYLRGGHTVNVMVIRPFDGVLMFYDWQIVEAIHTITAGEYVVNLTMFRTLMGPKLATDATLPGFGIGAGNGLYSQTVSLVGSQNGISVGGKYSE